MIRIGLVRHFKVNHEKPARIMTLAQFEEWIEHYDGAEIIQPKKIHDLKWDHCFSSDMPRAQATAKALCDCPITESPLLREVPLSPFLKKDVKLPHHVWNAGGRFAWLASHRSQIESFRETNERANQFINELETVKECNILIVSHGFFLPVLIKQFKKEDMRAKEKESFPMGNYTF